MLILVHLSGLLLQLPNTKLSSVKEYEVDYKVKNALDAMKGSLQAVVDFLAHNGVSRARYVVGAGFPPESFYE